MITKTELQIIQDVLKSCEWIPTESGDKSFCPWCLSYESEGHTERCKIKLALEVFRR